MHVLHFITMPPPSQAPPKLPRETRFRKAHSLLNKQNSLLQKPVKICLFLS